MELPLSPTGDHHRISEAYFPYVQNGDNEKSLKRPLHRINKIVEINDLMDCLVHIVGD